MSKNHESTKFDHLDGPKWGVATQREVVERYRRLVREADPGTARNFLVADLAAQEQILAELMSPPRIGNQEGGGNAVKTAS